MGRHFSYLLYCIPVSSRSVVCLLSRKVSVLMYKLMNQTAHMIGGPKGSALAEARYLA